MARTRTFNRQQEDIGNILSMEHVNLRVPDQTTAAWFYVSGLGLTRDPFVDFGSFNIWINVGAQQFHLPTGKPQVLRGEVHITVPNLDELEHRLNKVSGRLKDTQFSFKRTAKEVVAQCPWGNTIRCRGESPENRTGMHAVSFKVEAEVLPGINRFYQQIFKCPTKLLQSKLEVVVGLGQKLMFVASKKVPEYDGHHLAIYCPDFSGPYEEIKARKFISEESNQHQYRFETIFDPDNGEPLCQVEHEVRSIYHPMFNRHLVNRNPAQTFAAYAPGRDQYYPQT